MKVTVIFFLLLAATISVSGQDANQVLSSCNRQVQQWEVQTRADLKNKYIKKEGLGFGSDDPWENIICKPHNKRKCQTCRINYNSENNSINNQAESKYTSCQSAYQTALNNANKKRERDIKEQEVKEAREKDEKFGQKTVERTGTKQQTTAANFSSPTTEKVTTVNTTSRNTQIVQQNQDYINSSNQRTEEITQILVEGIQTVGSLLLEARQQKRQEKEVLEANREAYRAKVIKAQTEKNEQIEFNAARGSIKDIVAFAELKIKDGVDLDMAHLMFKQAAELNNPDAMYGLYMDYLVGRGTVKDYALAQHWLNRAAKYGSIPAMQAINTPKWKYFSDFLDTRLSMNDVLVKSYAEFYEGRATISGLKTSLSWWQKYVELGEEMKDKLTIAIGKDHIKKLALALQKRKFAADEVQLQNAEYWFVKGMENYAIYNRQDSAIACLTKSAEIGDEEAMIVLAQWKETDDPNPENYEQIIKLYLKADSGRHAYAYRLASRALLTAAITSFSVENGEASALAYLKRAASLNNTEAISHLITIYKTGIYIPNKNTHLEKPVAVPSDEEAAKWSRLLTQELENELLPTHMRGKVKF